MIPGELIGSGRTADVYALDGERVLRRVRDGSDVTAEAAALDHAVRHGYPAPRVLSADGPDLVMERLTGPTMLAALGGGRLDPAAAGATLADLLRRLHTVPPRPGAVPGTRLLHLDLHPDNVILTPVGPMVIDWTNARDGAPALDVAMSALILAQVAVDETHPAAPGARLLLTAFLSHGLDLRGELRAAERYRGANPTMSAQELAVIPRAVALIEALTR